MIATFASLVTLLVAVALEGAFDFEGAAATGRALSSREALAAAWVAWLAAMCVVAVVRARPKFAASPPRIAALCALALGLGSLALGAYVHAAVGVKWAAVAALFAPLVDLALAARGRKAI